LVVRVEDDVVLPLEAPGHPARLPHFRGGMGREEKRTERSEDLPGAPQRAGRACRRPCVHREPLLASGSGPSQGECPERRGCSAGPFPSTSNSARHHPSRNREGLPTTSRGGREARARFSLVPTAKASPRAGTAIAYEMPPT